MTDIMLVNPSGHNIQVDMEPTTEFFETVLGGRLYSESTYAFTVWYSMDEKELGTRANLPASLFYYRWTGDVKFFYGSVALTGPSPYGDPHQVEEKYFLSMKDYCRDHLRTVH